MGHRKQNILATATETSTPPDALTLTQAIAKIVKAEGNNLYTVAIAAPSKQFPSATMLVELPSRFRNTIWMKRGGFVLIDTTEAAARENKIGGEIANVVRDEKAWRKMEYWPAQFQRRNEAYEDSEEEEESVVGKMPPSSDDED